MAIFLRVFCKARPSERLQQLFVVLIRLLTPRTVCIHFRITSLFSFRSPVAQRQQTSLSFFILYFSSLSPGPFSSISSLHSSTLSISQSSPSQLPRSLKSLIIFQPVLVKVPRLIFCCLPTVGLSSEELLLFHAIHYGALNCS